jgi:hypothetical protein
MDQDRLLRRQDCINEQANRWQLIQAARLLVVLEMRLKIFDVRKVRFP